MKVMQMTMVQLQLAPHQILGLILKEVPFPVVAAAAAAATAGKVTAILILPALPLPAALLRVLLLALKIALCEIHDLLTFAMHVARRLPANGR